MSNWFLRLAVLYFALGVLLGNIMGASHDFTLTPVHAHLNLLGWASLFLFGLWYRVMPTAATTRLAKAHFWLHNIGLPIQMVALTVFIKGNTAAEPVLGAASAVIGIGVLCFAVNLWQHTDSTKP